MNRATLALLVTLALLAAPFAAGAQPVWRLGVLATAPRERIAHLVKALQEGLRDLGYVVSTKPNEAASLLTRLPRAWYRWKWPYGNRTPT